MAEITDASNPNAPLFSDWSKFIHNIPIGDIPGRLDMITAGKRDENYYDKVRNFDVKNFYAEKKGGLIIEKIRKAWKDLYDFVLVDSRTGITDIGGICTIQLPDILVLLFTATEQGFKGVGEVAERVLNTQKSLPLERLNLLIFPILTRIDGSEKALTKEWIAKFIEGSENLPISLNKMYKTWLPERIDRKSFVQQVLIPYVAFYSFGEGLPVEEESYATDVQGMGYAYESIAASLATHLNYPHFLVEDRSKLLKLANKGALKDIRENIREIVHREIRTMDFFPMAVNTTASSLTGKGVEWIINLFQEVIKQGLPQNRLSLADIARLKEDNFSETEMITEWGGEDPLEQFSDHLAIRIFYQIKDIDRDVIQSLKDDLGKAIIENVTKSLVIAPETLLRLKRILKPEEPAGIGGDDVITKNLQLLQFELSRSINDKLFFLIEDHDLVKLGRRFDELFVEKTIGLQRNLSEPQSASPEQMTPFKTKSSRLKVLGFLALAVTLSLLAFFLLRNKGSVDPIVNTTDSTKKTNLADMLADTAADYAIYGDSINASIYYVKAADVAKASNDTDKEEIILKNHSVQFFDSSNISDLDARLEKLIESKYQRKLFKVDIFYVDSIYEKENNKGEKFMEQYAEIIADQLLRELGKEANLVVRKRLISPKTYATNPYLAEVNQIRYERKTEGEQANEILKLLTRSRLKEEVFFLN